jgi:hypothetical protein
MGVRRLVHQILSQDYAVIEAQDGEEAGRSTRRNS